LLRTLAPQGQEEDPEDRSAYERFYSRSPGRRNALLEDITMQFALIARRRLALFHAQSRRRGTDQL